MRISTTLLGAALGAAALPAFAGPVQDARHHLKAIADADVSAIMADYGPNAVFEWVGGPLDGTYTGKVAIKTVWKKFTKVNGHIGYKVSDLQVAANPQGATVTANVVFKLKKPLKVRYVMLYRHGKLVDEIWQIAPKLKAAAY